MTAVDPGGRLARVVAIAGGVVMLGAGWWAMAAPVSFFDAMARFDPYNQHFIQDIGAFQLGLGTVLILAAVPRRADPLVVALLGTGLGAAAHAVSHIIGRDLGGTPSVDIPIFSVSAVALLTVGAYRFMRLRPGDEAPGRR